jgi:hypothetical protein
VSSTLKQFHKGNWREQVNSGLSEFTFHPYINYIRRRECAFSPSLFPTSLCRINGSPLPLTARGLPACSLDFFFRLFLLYQDKRNEHQAALAAKTECGITVKVKTEKLATENTEKNEEAMDMQFPEKLALAS